MFTDTSPGSGTGFARTDVENNDEEKIAGTRTLTSWEDFMMTFDLERNGSRRSSSNQQEGK